MGLCAMMALAVKNSRDCWFMDGWMDGWVNRGSIFHIYLFLYLREFLDFLLEEWREKFSAAFYSLSGLLLCDEIYLLNEVFGLSVCLFW